MTVFCSVCKDIIKHNGVRCVHCESSSHEKCALDSGGRYNSERQWTCGNCAGTDGSRSTSSDSSEIQPAAPSDMFGKHQFDAIMNQLSAISFAVQRCNNNIESNNKLLSLHGEQTTKCNDEIARLRCENESLRSHVVKLEQRVDRVDLDALHAEMRDRAARENNLIFLGLAEKTPQLDREQVEEMLASFVGVFDGGQPLGITAVSRVGKRRQNIPRPVKVCFADKRVSIVVLKNKRKLDRTKYPAVIIRADLTLEQRRRLAELRAELKTRISNGETDITIKYVKGQPSIAKVSDTAPSKRRREEDESPPRQHKFSDHSRLDSVNDGVEKNASTKGNAANTTSSASMPANRFFQDS